MHCFHNASGKWCEKTDMILWAWFRAVLLSSLLLLTCMCVCVCSSDWLCGVYSLCAPPRWAQSPGVTFDLTGVIKRRQDHFLLWTRAAQLAPATHLLLQHHRATVIGADRLNKKSLRYSSDFLIGRYSEGCKESEHTGLMFGVYRFDKELGALLNKYDAVRVSTWTAQRLDSIKPGCWRPAWADVS